MKLAEKSAGENNIADVSSESPLSVSEGWSSLETSRHEVMKGFHLYLFPFVFLILMLQRFLSKRTQMYKKYSYSLRCGPVPTSTIAFFTFSTFYWIASFVMGLLATFTYFHAWKWNIWSEILCVAFQEHKNQRNVLNSEGFFVHMRRWDCTASLKYFESFAITEQSQTR